jgi:hypothetical protein
MQHRQGAAIPLWRILHLHLTCPQFGRERIHVPALIYPFHRSATRACQVGGPGHSFRLSPCTRRSPRLTAG